MKTVILAFLLTLESTFGFAQINNEADSLIRLLPTLPNDTNKVWILEKIASNYGFIKPDIGREYAQKGLNLAQKLQFKKGEVMCLSRVGWMYSVTSDPTRSLEYQIKALKIAETIQYKSGMRRAMGMINSAYRSMGNYDLALLYNFQILKLAEEMNDRIENALHGTGQTYLRMNRLDSALFYSQKAYLVAKRKNTLIRSDIPSQLGDIYCRLKNYNLAKKYYNENLLYYQKFRSGTLLPIFAYIGLAEIYQKLDKRDSCIYFAEKAFEGANKGGYIQALNQASTLLASAYDSIAPLKSLPYYKIVISTRDSLNNTEKLIQFQKISLEEQRRQQAIEAEKERYNNLLWRYGLLLGLLFMGVIAFILFRNNQHKQKANNLLYRQKEEINHQKEKVEKTLTELKSTQAQLIQKEKLASLGELTAGIAHEIQNPLNFVNNFSELSVGIAQDLEEEIKNSPLTPNGGIIIEDKTYFNELISDLTQNQAKINHHGKRASSIVSGMLEHSRTSTGERVMTDINKLADEYLRLSYHGMRVKNMNGSTGRFNADYEFIADEDLPLVNVVPQDIGRVLLNLINNAFYATNVGEVKPAVELLADVKSPKVIVKTEHTNNQLIIKVIDNGIGMKEEVKAKIFQPFFTTKPTGEGTGLGLSLAYDIVNKGHGGTIEVESVEGEGATFVVKLPFGQ